MKSTHLRFFALFLLFSISEALYSQDIQRINEQIFKQLDTIKNIASKKIISRHFSNGRVKEVGLYIKISENSKKKHGYVGFHLNYYKNGKIKDSVYFDTHTNLSGIGKGYYEDGKLRYLCIGRDVSIEDGLHYSKFRTGLCDSYSMFYFKSGILGSEFGVNFRKNNNFIMDHAICTISYNEDGTIKSSEIYK
jgi:hypothetical protein